MNQGSFLQRLATPLLFAAVAMVSASCGEVARSGRSPAILIIQALEGSSGADPDEFSSTMLSDVQTMIESTVNGSQVLTPTIYNDLGRVTFRLTLKNPGTPTTPLSPSPLNDITVTRYKVQFRRSDGRNTEGLDVPYGFVGAVTATVQGSGESTVVFDLVRHQHKLEPPLRNLINGGSARFISTVAEITFYGQDLAGNEVTATGSLNVNFGDWADPS